MCGFPLWLAIAGANQTVADAVTAEPGVIDVVAFGEAGLAANAAIWSGLLLSAPPLLALGAFQAALLARGRTIGKWRMGLRIVDQDGQPAGLLRAFLLRTVPRGPHC